jgi:sugar phosphate isomerase/epimerase
MSLAAGTVLDATPAQAVTAAARAGFDALGLRLDPMARSTLEQASLRRLRQRMDDAGVALLDIEVVRLQPGDPADRHRPLVEAAATLGARFLLAVSDHADHPATAAALRALCDLAAPYGVRIALEFMPFSTVRTVAEAVAVVRACGAENATVVVDALHLFRSGGTPADLRDLAPAPGYVQLSDAALPAPAGTDALAREARHARLLPGDGGLPLVDLLRHVPPGTPLSVEVQSDALNTRYGPDERAWRCLRAARALVAAAAA